jgi:hypothetical protein
MLLYPPQATDFHFREAKSPVLHIVTYSDTIRGVVIRGLTVTGLIHDAFNTLTNFTQSTRNVAITEIPISLTVEAAAAGVKRGQLYVQVFLQLSGVNAALLTAGYVSSQAPLSYPESGITPPTFGPGYLYQATVADPAAGADFAMTVPNNCRWRVHAVKFQLDTDGTVLNRTAILNITGSGVRLYGFARPTDVQAASTSKLYTFANYDVVPATYDDIIAGQLPRTLIANPGGIGSTIDNLQAGDQISTITADVEQWLDI